MDIIGQLFIGEYPTGYPIDESWLRRQVTCLPQNKWGQGDLRNYNVWIWAVEYHDFLVA
jgi:hypothetical protein